MSAPRQSSAPKTSGGSSALLFILLGGGALLFLVGAGIIVLVLAAARIPDEKPPVVAVADPDAGPLLENKDPGPAPDAGSAKTKPKLAGTGTGTGGGIVGGTGGAVVPPPPPPPPKPPPFPRARARDEVDRVIASAQSCARAGDPSGTGTVRVDFEPEGRVQTVTRPPFAFTPTGECIAARMRAIRIGAFDGTVQSIEGVYIIKAVPKTDGGARGVGF